MFSKAARNCIIWSTHNVEFWKTVPVKLDPGTGSPVLVNSKTRRALAFANVVALCAYSTFLGTSCILTYMDSASGTEQQVLSEYFFGTSLMWVLYQAVLVLQRRQFLAFVRTYPKSLEHIWDLLDEGANMKSDRQEWSIFPKIMIWITRLLSWMTLTLVFLMPASPNFLSSLLVNKKDNNNGGNSIELWKVAPFAVVQAYLSFSGSSVMCFVGVNLVSYVNAAAQTARMLTLKDPGPASEPTLLARMTAYRQLQVLQGIASDALVKVMVGQKLLCLTLVIRCLYGAIMIRGPHRFQVVTDIISHLGFLSAVFSAVANTYESSEESLEGWKSQRHNGLFRRMHRSCTPLKIRMGGMYHVDQSMMLSMWSFILDGTVNLVLTGSVM